jgi:hypothetical protein
LRLIDNEINDYVIDNVLRLKAKLGKCESLRIDGRMTAEKFDLIEITPDTHLGKRAEFVFPFILRGWEYHDVLEAILLSTIQKYQYQLSNNSS